MAADTRPYKSKEQDGQGNEIILRDQQLVEQASQTTMASDEYFEIVDVDGRMAKIPKANMVDIVREALGSLLNGLTDQTTVTKVPSLNGNTLGASTVATLASVLGVKVIPSGTIDIDDPNVVGDKIIGWYSVSNSGVSYFSCLIGVCGFQLKHSKNTTKLQIRYPSYSSGLLTFTAWQDL